MKKFLTLTVLLLLTLTSVALAKNTVKIARLPIIIQKNHLDYETAVKLEVKMARAVKIPLNQTLNIAEYLPPKESSQILGEIWREMYDTNHKAKISDAVKKFAREVDADLVICPILRQYSQRVSTNFNFESHLSSTVSAELIVYDKRAGVLIDKKTSRRYNDSYNRFGTASYLAGECLDQLIRDTGLRQIIHSKRG